MAKPKKQEATKPAEQLPVARKEPLADAAMAALAISMRTSQVTSSGPIPAPEVLAKYDAIYPGLAKHIVDMAAAETAHRREIERTAQQIQRMDIRSYRLSELLGQTFGFLIGTIAICGAVYAGVHGAQIAGAFIGTAGVTGLVTAFIVGRRQLAKQQEVEFNRQMQIAKALEEKQKIEQALPTPPTVH